MKYPNIDDSDFYYKINDIFRKYKIRKSSKGLKELCFPKKFKLQNPQSCLKAFKMNNFTGFLVFLFIFAFNFL